MIPPNIKEEIEKEAQEYSSQNSRVVNEPFQCDTTKDDLHECYVQAATQFYLKGVGDRDAIAKAAFEAGRENRILETPIGNGTYYRTMFADDYLASDEYKKLVGEI